MASEDSHTRSLLIEDVSIKWGDRRLPKGALFISPLHLNFTTSVRECDIKVLMTDILSAEISSSKTQQQCVVLLLKLKDFRMLCFELPVQEDGQKAMEMIKSLSLPDDISYMMCFQLNSNSKETVALQLSDIGDVMMRWGCPSDEWRLTTANQHFDVCSSYPKMVAIPSRITDQDIRIVAKFRYLGRFPRLSYYHKKTCMPLMSSSQPMIGMTGKKSFEDLGILNATLSQGNRGLIVDTRTATLAQSHLTKGGGGTERLESYPRWNVVHADLDSYQQLHVSLNRLVDLCQSPNLSGSSGWFGKLDSSSWLRNIRQLLITSRLVMGHLNKGQPVLVHGESGYDTELQVTSLVQIIMESYNRTCLGFVELIEREWLSAGHPFSRRHRHCATVPLKESGPVFLAFLDSVYQLLTQFPTAFEFNETLLHYLFLHSYSSDCGTFLYDCPGERFKNKIKIKTHSLWNHILNPITLKSFRNPLFERFKHSLNVSVSPQDIVLWTNCYLRQNPFKSCINLPAFERLRSVKERVDASRLKAKELQKEILSVQNHLRKRLTGSNHLLPDQKVQVITNVETKNERGLEGQPSEDKTVTPFTSDIKDNSCTPESPSIDPTCSDWSKKSDNLITNHKSFPGDELVDKGVTGEPDDPLPSNNQFQENS